MNAGGDYTDQENGLKRPVGWEACRRISWLYPDNGATAAGEPLRARLQQLAVPSPPPGNCNPPPDGPLLISPS